MSSLVQKVKDFLSRFRQHPNESTPNKSEYPPAVIDWSKFEPAGPNDVRSPCPMLNALCNHHILPHSGRNISKQMAVEALAKSLNLDNLTSSVFAGHAVGMNPHQPATTFDADMLAKHGDIEHDVSLSRNDILLGDNNSFDPEIWKAVLATYGDAETTSFESAATAHQSRVEASKAAHDAKGVKFQYGIKELVMSYGESALFLGLLGDPKTGKVPLKYVRVLFEEARVPYNEGWRRIEQTVTQKDMTHMIHQLIEANPRKHVEAEIVQIGTIEAIKSSVEEYMPHYCTVM